MQPEIYPSSDVGRLNFIAMLLPPSLHRRRAMDQWSSAQGSQPPSSSVASHLEALQELKAISADAPINYLRMFMPFVCLNLLYFR
jgi:hypothetical protein